MSHLQWIPPQSGGATPLSAWRWFPWLVGVAIGVVVAVNAGMIYMAVTGFPGKPSHDGFSLNNQYNAVLELAQREASLGWTMLARADDAGRPQVTLTDRKGSPLRGASVAASAERPLGTPETHRFAFHETAAGQYVANTPLPAHGQWDLTLSASTGGQGITATRRIIVR